MMEIYSLSTIFNNNTELVIKSTITPICTFIQNINARLILFQFRVEF